MRHGPVPDPDLRGRVRCENADAETFAEIIKGHQDFGEKNGAALRGGNALQPTATATSIRRDASGGFAITDGAFAETKEALGGYYLIEAADLDEAIAVAKQVPAPFGGVEVRPSGSSTDRPWLPTPRSTAAVADAHRREWAFVLAATVRVTARSRPGRGVRAGRLRPGAGHMGGRRHPGKPGAWLTTVARRRAFDLRRGRPTHAPVAAAAPRRPAATPGRTRPTRRSPTTGCG